MTEQRSDKVYYHYLQAEEKFDYFILGVALALVSYLGADLELTAIDLTSSGLQALAAASCLASGFCGFKRIESTLSVVKTMHRRLHAEETAGALAQVATSGQAHLNKSTGKTLTPSEALAEHQFYRVGAELTEAQLDDLVKKSGRWYRARNALLMAGLGLLLLSKILPSYLG